MSENVNSVSSQNTDLKVQIAALAAEIDFRASAEMPTLIEMPSPERNLPQTGLTVKIEIKKSDLLNSTKRIPGVNSSVQRAVLPELQFSEHGLVTLAFCPQGIGWPLMCRVQQENEGPVPAGTIWVPVAKHLLVRGSLNVELNLFGAEFTDGDARCRLIALPATVTDVFFVDAGALLCIGLGGAQNSAMSRDLTHGRFRAVGSMLVPELPAEGAAQLRCVIACTSNETKLHRLSPRPFYQIINLRT